MFKNEMNNYIDNVRATMAVENHKLDSDDTKLMEMYLNNEVSMAEALNIIKKSVIEE